MLLAVRSLLSGKEDDSSPRFPRAVCVLGGPSPKCVPDYMKRTAIANTSKYSMGLLQNLSHDDLEGLFLWCLRREWQCSS
eukprot:600288-Lingulodinium_polyedra.AAC.1